MASPEKPSSSPVRNAVVITAIVVAVIVVAALVVSIVIWVMHNKSDKPKRQTTTITVIRPPPPPPPDEPPPPPPPEKTPEQVVQNEPEPSPSDDSAPSEQLGVDAEGAAGGDSFGLAARKGGHDLVGSGGAIFGWYTARLKDRVSEKLSADTKLRAQHFTVSVRVWLEPDGRIREVRVVNGTGNGELDSAIQAAVAAIGKMADPPPLEMPEPVTIKIVSRAG